MKLCPVDTTNDNDVIVDRDYKYAIVSRSIGVSPQRTYTIRAKFTHRWIADVTMETLKESTECSNWQLMEIIE